MSVNDKQPRPLRPRISPVEGLASDATSESSQSIPDVLSQTRVRGFRTTRSNIRSACLACRQRRSKCSGGDVCNRCRSRGTHCIYEESQDRRTRAVRDKGKEELELHKRVIDGVFRAIRNGGDEAILNLVRQHASLQTIAAAVEDDPTAESDRDYQGFDYSESPSAETSPSISRDMPLPSPWFDENQIHNKMESSKGASRTPNSTVHVSPDLEQMHVSSSFTGNESEHLDEAIVVPEHESLAFRYMLKPVHEASSSAADNLSRFYIQFRDASQQMIAHGVPIDTILGPGAINCGALFHTGQSSEQLNVASWAAAIVNSFPDLDIYFKLAWMVLLVRFMRWCIDTTRENFEALPEIMKPTSLQISMHHTPLIDLAPIPQLRDCLIKNFSDFTSTLQMAGAGVSWHGTFEDAVCQHPTTGRMTITDAFEKHAADAKHYIFGRRLLQTYAELESHINVADQDRLVPRSEISLFA